MIVAEDGQVFTAGLYNDGQLGRPGDNSIFIPVLRGEMNTDSQFLQNISTAGGGLRHSLVLTQDCHMLAFGGNYYGQLGNGKSSEDYVGPEAEEPTPVWVHAGDPGVATGIRRRSGDNFTILHEIPKNALQCRCGRL